MSRSKHGHKHVGRAKCGVCSGTIGAARRARERESGLDDRLDGEIEAEECWLYDIFECDGHDCLICSCDVDADDLPAGVTFTEAA